MIKASVAEILSNKEEDGEWRAVTGFEKLGTGNMSLDDDETTEPEPKPKQDGPSETVEEVLARLEQKQIDDQYEALIFELQTIAKSPRLTKSRRFTGKLQEMMDELEELQKAASDSAKAENIRKIEKLHKDLESSGQNSDTEIKLDSQAEPDISQTIDETTPINEDIEKYKRKFDEIRTDPDFLNDKQLLNTVMPLMDAKIRANATTEIIETARTAIEDAYTRYTAKKELESRRGTPLVGQEPEREFTAPPKTTEEPAQASDEILDQAKIEKEKKEINRRIDEIEKRGDDYYNLLGVEKTATQEKIRDKFKKLVKEFHPDIVEPLNDEKLTTRAKDISQKILSAHDVLSDEDQRRMYDQGGQGDASHETIIVDEKGRATAWGGKAPGWGERDKNWGGKAPGWGERKS